MSEQRRAGQLVYIYKTAMFDRVFALYWPCAYPGAVLRHASGPTIPRKKWFLVDQIVDPGIIEITLLHRGSQTWTLKNHTTN